MEIKQVIFSLFQKGSKEGIGILTLRLLFPLRASGCSSQLLGSSNNILTYRFSLNGQKSVLTVMNLLWSASPTHQGSTFFSLFSRMSPSYFFIGHICHKGNKSVFCFSWVFLTLFHTHTKQFPCTWGSTANWQGFGESVPMSATVCSGISGEY